MRVREMKFAKTGAARAAMAVALATGPLAILAAGGAVLGAAPAFAKEKEAPKASYSKEFVAAAAPLQKIMTDTQAALAKGTPAADVKATLGGAPALLAAGEAAAKTSQDRLVIGQWGVQLGGWIDDNAMRQRGIRNMLDSGMLEPAKVPLFNFYLGNFAYAEKNWPVAIEALTKAVSLNTTEDQAAEMLADAYAEQGKPAEALQALRMALDTRKAAGGAVPEAWFKRANLIAYKGKLGPQAIEWSTLLVDANPSPINWLGAGQLTREFGNFTKEESLDLGRLFLRTGALGNDKQYVEREFIEYIESADPRRLPGETLKIAELGISKGVLKTSDMFVSEAMSQAKGRIPADKASLPGLERDANKAADGKTAMAAADAFLSYDDPVKAEEFYKLALTKGNIDKDRALTRLGIAQTDQNKIDDAKATFAQVTGTRAPLAKLWSVYAADKAKP